MRQFFSARKTRRAPQLPEGVRVYAVGDVHGRADLLAKLLSEIDSHLAQNPVPRPIEVFLGDYVDRGPSSRAVIDLLVSRRNSNEKIYLKGNHEKYVLDFLRDPKTWNHWRQYGGVETLLSYGLGPQEDSDPADQEELARKFADCLPREHLLFLSCLVTSFTSGDFFFAHAGVKPGIPLDQQSEKSLLLIRDEFLLSKVDFGKYIIHGHTPVREPDIRSNRANIDTGAFVTGCLSCLVIEGERMHVLAPNGGGPSKSADESQKADVAATAVVDLPEIPFVTEGNFTIAPRQGGETIDSSEASGGTPSSSSASARDARTDPEQPEHLLRAVHQKASDDGSRTAPSGRDRLQTISGSIFALLLLTAVALLVPILAPRWQVGANPGGAESHVGSGVTKPGSDTAQAAPAPSARLVLDQSSGGSAGDSAPLDIRVSGQASGLFIEIDGLPTGVTLSSGRSLGSSRWRISATEVGRATIHAPQGIAGTTDLVVELRLADDSVVDRGSLHLQWPTTSAIVARTEALAGVPERPSDASSKIPVTPPTDQNADFSPPASQLDHPPIPLPRPALDARVNGKNRVTPGPQGR